MPEKPITVPIEDIGIVILDNRRITVTSSVISSLLQNKSALITCSDKHMPEGMLLLLDSHTVQQERFGVQIAASLPLKKRLWQQIIMAKIRNQAEVLNLSDKNAGSYLLELSMKVKVGDTGNCEAIAASYYWKRIFPYPNFIRDRFADDVNVVLNYGYTMLRAVVARALVCAGLLPTLGIHHHNKYNSYCLADDVMEPYRPYVDKLILKLNKEGLGECLDEGTKINLLKIPVLDVEICGDVRPLMLAVQQTAVSLVKCFTGERRKLDLPRLK